MNLHTFGKVVPVAKGSRQDGDMGLAPSERASKIIRVHIRKLSFDGLRPNVSWVKWGPGYQTGGRGHGQSGAPCRPGGECFAPPPSPRGSAPSCFFARLLYEVPGGNLVDGLPPAASNTGEDVICPAPLPYKCMISTPLIAICSRSFYRNDLARSQKLRMVISFHFI